MTTRHLDFSGRNSNRANTAFTIGLFTILAALCFEYIGGYKPCELCNIQRLPYYIGLPLLAIVIGNWNRVPVPWRVLITLALAGLFIWGIYLGAFHAGVEWGFWPGPTACTGVGGNIGFDSLSELNTVETVVPCDQPQFRMLGISFAGYNAIISTLISFFLLWSALGQYNRWRHEKEE